MNECREAFEKWGSSFFMALGRNPGNGAYKSSLVENMWDAWQAAWNYKEKSDEA